MYRGKQKTRRVSAKEFLQIVRSECRKGCKECRFRTIPNEILEDNLVQIKKICMFHYFDQLPEDSIDFVIGKVNKM